MCRCIRWSITPERWCPRSPPAPARPAKPGRAGPAASPTVPAAQVDAALADAHRAEWAAVVAATARLTGDLDLAEECAQEAFARAVEVWPGRGIPDRPGAWLTTVAANRARDVLRRDAALRRRLPLLVREAPADDGASWHSDDRLRLIFTCCHPALARESQVALTLRLVCGVSTGDIAAAFLVGESAMAARVTAREAQDRHGAHPVPGARRVGAAGAGGSGVRRPLPGLHGGARASFRDAVVRADLVEEAIALTRLLHGLLPADRSVAGLLALMLLIDARRDTRDELLADQDRSRWDRRSSTRGPPSSRRRRRERWTAMRSRRRSPPCTRRRRRGATRTGRGSPTSTGCSRRPGRAPSSRSTARSPWACATGQPLGSPRSTPSPPTPRSRGIRIFPRREPRSSWTSAAGARRPMPTPMPHCSQGARRAAAPAEKAERARSSAWRYVGLIAAAARTRQAAGSTRLPAASRCVSARRRVRRPLRPAPPRRRAGRRR